MRISIVTPSFNQARFIKRTIDSVLDQQGDFELEYRILDGGSTDGTIDILKSYGNRVSWICEPDRGQVDAIRAVHEEGIVLLEQVQSQRQVGSAVRVQADPAARESESIGAGLHQEVREHAAIDRLQPVPRRGRGLRGGSFLAAPAHGGQGQREDEGLQRIPAQHDHQLHWIPPVGKSPAIRIGRWSDGRFTIG